MIDPKNYGLETMDELLDMITKDALSFHVLDPVIPSCSDCGYVLTPDDMYCPVCSKDHEILEKKNKLTFIK